MSEAQVDQTTDQTQRRLVIKHQNQFLLLDLQGGMAAQNGAGLGLYVNDTRFLSRWEMTINGGPLHFLSADADEGFACRLNYSNSAMSDIPAGSLSVNREIVVDEKEIVSEIITLRNHRQSSTDLVVKLAFAADFADMFEVRGSKRERRGHHLATKLTRGKRSQTATISYVGLDNIVRRSRVAFSHGNEEAVQLSLSSSEAVYRLTLPALQTLELTVCITTSESGEFAVPAGHFLKAPDSVPAQNHGRRFAFARTSKFVARTSKSNPLTRARRAYEQWKLGTARISTSNSDFNRLLDRSLRDIYLLRQDTVAGQTVAAGVPWFAVPFGRDSLIAGLQTLPFMPALSLDILQFLAAYQGKNYDQDTGEKPGRIMHELRPGEMAGLAEIPFRPYFGTVDATQLWLMLFARYVAWTGNLESAKKLWPAAQAALNYLSRESIKGGITGFVTYGGTAGAALSNQGWKDSGNCIVYSSGELAKAPIAVCEAQGYLYAAWTETASVARLLGYERTASRLEENARKLKKKFNRDFWMPEHNAFAIALDGDGKQCDAIASNAGHLLGTGILSPEREKLVCGRLMQTDMFSGWGIRTLASSEAAYQPMDYQVGAVWPHDNGIIAHGMCQAGEHNSAQSVLKAMLDVAMSQSDLRLPELFAGFDRGQERQPVPYQVACVPQLWAAGCAFHMTAGLLGLGYDHETRTLKVMRPSLPLWLDHIQLDGLNVGDAEVNMTFKRSQTSGLTTVEIVRVKGNLRCLVEY